MNEHQVISMLASHLGAYRYWLCPNMMLGHNELDLFGLSRSGVAHEWEVKVSMADWKNDLKKGVHGAGRSNGVERFTYVVDVHLLSDDPDLSWVPDYAGIWTIRDNGHINKLRPPKKINTTKKLTKEEVWRLCYYRYWSLRDQQHRVINPIRDQMDRVNESLQQLMVQVEDRWKFTRLHDQPDPWKRSNGALEKISGCR